MTPLAITLLSLLHSANAQAAAFALNQPAPDWSAPGVNLSMSFWAAAIPIGFIVCAVAFVGGGACIAIGRGISNGTLQKVGISLCVGAIVGAALIASGGKAINWGADQNL